MSKPQTEAALELVSQDSDGNITLSTAGTKAAPGAKLTSWSTPWGDGTSIFGSGKPPATINHKYLQDGDYLATLSVLDNKNKKAIASQMIIVRISPPPPPTTPPNILSVSPGSGNIGAAVSITGTNFGSTQGTSKVYFNGTLAAINTWSGTSISCNVPNGATTGQVIVVVANQSSNGVTFTVTGAATYDFIVDVGGVDSAGTPGTLAQPFATITYAIQRASAALTGTGKVIGVRGAPHNTGLLDQNVNRPNAGGTSWTNKVRVVNYQSETVTLQPTDPNLSVMVFGFTGSGASTKDRFVEFDGINIDGVNSLHEGINITSTLAVDMPNNIRWMNLDMKGNTTLTNPGGYNRAGVLIGCDDHTATGGFQFLSCSIHGFGANDFDHGMYVGNKDLLVDNCDIYDCVGAAIQLQSLSGNGLITGNVISDTTLRDARAVAGMRHWGIIVSNWIDNPIVYNCLSYGIRRDDSSSTGASAAFINYTGNATFEFCTAVDNGGVGFYMDSSSGNTLTRNCIGYNNATVDYQDDKGGQTQDHNSFGVNPVFVNQAGHNYHLTAGTPTDIKTGGIAIGGITTDKDGVSRPDPPSKGCYQFF